MAALDMTVADAQAVVDEALGTLDELRRGLLEIMECIREEGGETATILAPFVAPYVSKETLMTLIRERVALSLV